MASGYRRRRQTQENSLLLLLLVVVVAGFSLGDTTISSLNTMLVLAVIAVAVVGLTVLAAGLLIARKRRYGLRQLDQLQIDAMSGVAFEKWVAEQLRVQGYKVRLTPNTDYGVDIVATKNRVKTAVQVKRYSNKLDQKPIREAVAGMLFYNCSASMVVTNSYFTNAAKNLAASNHCRLVDRDELSKWFTVNPPR